MGSPGKGLDVVRTSSVSAGVARVAEDLVLGETPTTRTIFRTTVVNGKGLHGQIVRQKRTNKSEAWVSVNEVDFKKVPAGAGVSIEISTEGMARLRDLLMKLDPLARQGVGQGDREWHLAQAGRSVQMTSSDVAQQVGRMVQQGHSADAWQALADALDEADAGLSDVLASQHLNRSREQAIRLFEAGLAERPDDEAFWQALFRTNPWMLQCASAATVYVLDGGETYIGGKLPIGPQGKGGVVADFVTADASTKSFGVVEIKTPSANLIGRKYRGVEVGTDDDNDIDNLVYSMHHDLSGAVVQTRNQISVANEHFSSVLRRHPHGLKRLHPKGILVIGQLKGLSERQEHSFNEFRHGQHSLTILTFDELLRRLSITFEVQLQA